MKSLVVIQCRYNSSRLFGKALYPVAGRPMISFLLKRLLSGLPLDDFHLVLATSTNRLDDVIEEWGITEGVDVVRGPEHDVLGRYILCLQAFPSDTIIRVTADNPLTCPEIIKWLVNEKKKNNTDYMQCKNLPIGAGVDLFAADILKELNRKLITKDEREHINLHILRNPDNFRISSLMVIGETTRPDIILTIDTVEDWKHVNLLLDKAEKEPWTISLYEIVQRMDALGIRQPFSRQMSISS